MRVTHSVSKDGAAAISCWDSEEVVRAELGMFFEDDVPRFVLDQGIAVGLKRLTFCDEEGELRIAIDANDSDGDAGFILLDEEGATRAWFGTESESGSCRFALLDKNSVLRYSAYTDDDSDCIVTMRDAKGSERISSIAFANGRSFICLLNDENEPRILLTNTQDFPPIQVDDDAICVNTIANEELESESELPKAVADGCQHK